MTIEQLLLGKKDCECGSSHYCPIDRVIIGENACSCLSELAEGYGKILLVADENTFRACGDRVLPNLGARLADSMIFAGGTILVPDERAIEAIEKKIDESTDLIIGIGSGVINDLCKITSYKAGLPYFIVATAPSMDGYASKGSALILDGMKVTLNANVPKAIIADTEVLASAPYEMIQAGYGDIIGKYSCLNDWRLSACVNGEYLCPFVMNETYETVEKTVSLADGIRKRDEKAIGALMEALVAVGILMAYVGNSRPASGSEHHLSHYFEIVGILRGEDYLPHGIDVCCSAVETAKIREDLLSIPDIDSYACRFDRSEYEREIKRIYGGIENEIFALQDKVGMYGCDRVSIYREKWNEIREILADCPTADQMLDLCRKVGISYEGFRELYGEKKIFDALIYAKDLKDRYTVLWTYFDLVFGK